MVSLATRDLCTGWEFKPAVDDDEQSPWPWLPVARVPTVVQLDLMDNNKLPNTSQDMNELQAHWVGEKSWTYRCQFPTPPMSSQAIHCLVFEGLDTYATVYLNSEKILESDNMFIAHRVDVTAYLRTNELNVLQIDFDSAFLRGEAIVKAHPEHSFFASLGSPGRLGVRKAQYHWGWDWGPMLMTAGPWRPVRLETYQSRIEDLSIDYKLDDNLQQCRGVISVRVEGSSGDGVKLSVRDCTGTVVFTANCAVDGATSIAQADFIIQKPALWYPHGYGEQTRYYLDCKLIVSGRTAHAVTKRIAFRKAELIQQPDLYGKSFYFRINGVDIFAGGSCWIPADNFVPRLTAEKYRASLKLLVESNQIMVRIWGGGIYEEDIFYDTCDELGILIWQDFMFACGSYPGFPAFLKSVELEARSNVRRLRHHPSIVLYAGGNENYWIQEIKGLTCDYEDKDPQSWLKSSFPSRYIYEYLLPNVLSKESPSAIYHPDSPWGDRKPILDRSVGDIHQWEVWHGPMRPYQNYEQIGGRFNSEFGMQAYPHMSTINQYISDADEMYPQSLTMDFHNKASTHQRRLASYIWENFQVSHLDLKSWVYLTQLVQSEAMHYAYRCWRRQWGSPAARQCGGALVWQLNDCWPATSWAVVDYFLVKKPAFYTIRRALAPLAVGVLRTHEDWTAGHPKHPKSCAYDLWVAHSRAESLPSAVVEVRFISIRTGQDVLLPRHHEVDIRPNGTTVVCKAVELCNPPLSDQFVIFAKLVVGGRVRSRDVDWPQPYKYVSFKEDRGLQVHVAESRDKISIMALKPTKGLVFGERPGLRFSGNAFDVVPGEKYEVEVVGLGRDELLDWTYFGA